MRLSTTTVRERALEIDRAVEMKRAVRVDVDIKRLIIAHGIENADVAGLHKVIGDDDVFLIGSDFNVVRADGGLQFVGVVEAFDVVEVGDVERGDVVGSCECDCRGRGQMVSDKIGRWDQKKKCLR